MDVRELERLEEDLRAYLARFDDCFGRCDTRAHLTKDVRGQLSDLDAKSVEPIALQAGTPVRTLQEFLAQHRWNEDLLRQRLLQIIRDEHLSTHTVGIKHRRGRGRKTPRLKSGQPDPRSVAQVLGFSEAMKAQPWRKYNIKDSEKGPIVWKAKRLRVTLKGSDGLPGMQLWLVVAENVLDGERKFFVSNASESTSLSQLLLVAFQRWRVERCFEDQKQEVGLDCYEGRRYLGFKRHLIITAISDLFLSRACHTARGEKSGLDNSASSRRHERLGHQLVTAD